MLNVLIAGVGGQGSVLAAKILAQAALSRGWQVRTAETIGMAQRGGNVTSHVRMGNLGESVESSLIPQGCANVVIALEPGEGVRALPYLAPDGLMATASTPVPSVMSSLANAPYESAPLLARLKAAAPHFVALDDAAACEAAGSRKALNVCMLACAVQTSLATGAGLGRAVSLDDLQQAITACVKPAFVQMNQRAVESTVALLP